MADILDRPKTTEEELRQSFKDALAEISFTPVELASWMDERKDYREVGATIRSIQRMLAGDTRVSGEMMVIVNMIVRQHRRLKEKYGDLDWKPTEGGGFTTIMDGWHIYLSPQTRGRWILSCSCGLSRDDYSPPFGRWLDSLEEAKNKAYVTVEEGMSLLAEIRKQRREAQ